MRRGAAALEFALSLPFLLAVFAGIVDLCLYMSRAHAVARAARDGARVGSVTFEGTSPTGAVIEAAAIAQAEAVLEETGLGCDVGCNVGADWYLSGDWYVVTVTVEYPFTPLVGLVPGLGDHVGFEFTMMTQQQ